MESKYITITSNGKKIVLGVSTILYVLMVNKTAEIHISGGKMWGLTLAIGIIVPRRG